VRSVFGAAFARSSSSASSLSQATEMAITLVIGSNGHICTSAHPHIGRSGRRLTVGPGHARTGIEIARSGTARHGTARHRVATLAANQVADHWADIARHISSRPLPSVTRAGIPASRLEPPWRASRRQPGEMDGIGLIDPDLARDLGCCRGP
jgi:hypothetical protein